MDKHLVLSVHQLVDFLLRKGDIDNRIFNRTTMREGTNIHAFYQKKQGNDYLSEYSLKDDIYYEGIHITLQGRADGIISMGNYFIIDEIKSTIADLDVYFKAQKEWHLGQAICYAYMLCKEKQLSSVGVRLTYIKQDKSKEKLIKDFSYTKDELEQYVFSLLDQYLSFYQLIFRHTEKRLLSTDALEFPFKNFRAGQNELIQKVYDTAVKRTTLFCEAPTGIGKTISTLFPFIKASRDDELCKIFYLTAKNSGKESAKNAAKIMQQTGLDLYHITITAKEKICFCKDKECNPDECPFAKDYYSKIQGAIRLALSSDNSFDYSKIVDYAYQFEICPFEFQLDLALYMDLIICDYNYMFDPISCMHRFFDEDQSHYLALIDEAHNLVDRSKDMYSATIEEDAIRECRHSLRRIKNRKLKNMLKKVETLFLSFKEIAEEEYTILQNFKEDWLDIFDYFLTGYQTISKENAKDITSKTKDLYLAINRFMRIYELRNENFLLYVHKDNGGFISLHLFCQDASNFIRSIIDKNRANVFFSATLSPKDYYLNALVGEPGELEFLQLPSPFSKDNFRVLVAADLSIKYKNRHETYGQVASYIKAFTDGRVGNYFIYCPSYEYLSHLAPLFQTIEGIDLFVQDKDMDEIEKEAFLLNFTTNPTKTTLGLLVIGSIFSEGIDLIDDRLIGVVIIGVGLAKINFLNDELKKHYIEKGLNGYLYSYLYPGLNKVMQAVGRVIRSESDVGTCLFIDERYNEYQYRRFLKEHWPLSTYVHSPIEVKKITSYFFSKKKNMI